MASPADKYPEFSRAVAARLQAGREAYGDKSFSGQPAVLCGEIEQELLDVAGWAFILWTRVRAMRDAIEAKTSGEG